MRREDRWPRVRTCQLKRPQVQSKHSLAPIREAAKFILLRKTQGYRDKLRHTHLQYTPTLHTHTPLLHLPHFRPQELYRKTKLQHWAWSPLMSTKSPGTEKMSAQSSSALMAGGGTLAMKPVWAGKEGGIVPLQNMQRDVTTGRCEHCGLNQFTIQTNYLGMWQHHWGWTPYRRA